MQGNVLKWIYAFKNQIQSNPIKVTLFSSDLNKLKNPEIP